MSAYHGDKHHHSKVTADIVRAIRASTEIARVVGARYGLSIHQVRKIRQRRAWQRVR